MSEPNALKRPINYLPVFPKDLHGKSKSERLIRNFGAFFARNRTRVATTQSRTRHLHGCGLCMEAWFAKKTYTAMAVQAIVGATALDMTGHSLELLKGERFVNCLVTSWRGKIMKRRINAQMEAVLSGDDEVQYMSELDVVKADWPTASEDLREKLSWMMRLGLWHEPALPFLLSLHMAATCNTTSWLVGGSTEHIKAYHYRVFNSYISEQFIKIVVKIVHANSF